MNEPAISVIIPVYNVAPYLNQCVDSVLTQTLKDFELLLIDDGSTDTSPAVCDAYAARDARVRVVHQPNAGLSAARNQGLELARGGFITFVDGDDWLDLNTLALAMQAAVEARADIVLWPYVREYKGLSLQKRLFQFEHRVFDAQETRGLVCRRMVGLLGEELRHPENADALVTACAKLYRRELLEQSGASFTDTALIGTEDALFNLRALTHASRAVYINRFMYHYRRDNESSVTTRHKADLARQWSHLHELMKQHIADHSMGADFEQALRNRVSLSIVGIGLNALSSGLRPKVIVREISAWLCSAEYRDAVSTLRMKWFPPYWRLFFEAAKRRGAGVVWVLLRTMNSLRAWRNHVKAL